MTVEAIPAARGRADRMRRTRDFRRVMSEGRRINGRRVLIYLAPGDEGVRAGFVSGRRVGGAVARNRARRVLREAWRQVAPGVPGPVDVILVALPAIQESGPGEIAEEIRAAFARDGATVR